MYEKSFPFKTFKGKPGNAVVQFNLSVREVLKNLVTLKAVFEWKDSMNGELRELTTEEVVDFYNHFEGLLLEAWGELSEDGLHFRKAGKYEFEESALFDACMQEFLTNPEETGKLLTSILPDGMEELVRKVDENLALSAANATDEDMQKQIAQLQAQLAEVKTDTPADPQTA